MQHLRCLHIALVVAVVVDVSNALAELDMAQVHWWRAKLLGVRQEYLWKSEIIQKFMFYDIAQQSP